MDDEERRQAIRDLAREHSAVEGTLEVDDDAAVSEGDDNGAYVSAWVWVDFAGTEFDTQS